MATACGQPHSSSHFISTKTLYTSERRPPIHSNTRSPDSVDMATRTMRQQDAFIGEGLIDADEIHDIESLDDRQYKSVRQSRQVLDFLATDVAERYLDGIYNDEKPESDNKESVPEKHHDNQSALPSIWRTAMSKTNGERSGRSHMLGFKKKALTAKELAWQKVRHLLIQEEEQAALRDDRSSGKAADEASVSSHKSDDSYDTVKLLDYLAQTSGELSGYSHSTSSEGDADDGSITNSRVSLTGNNELGNNISGMSRQSAQTELLAMLQQVTRTCRTTELSDASIARISSRLASIGQIAREDMYKSSQQPQRQGSRHQSSFSTDTNTTLPKSDRTMSPSESLRVPAALRQKSMQGAVAPTVVSSFKAFVAAHDLGDTIRAFSKLMADCGLNGMKIDEPWHIYTHIKSAVYNKLGFRQRQLFKLLDTRFNLDVYKRRPAVGKRVCIIGAGPVGLRAALEIVMLGGQAVVLEKRTNFIRENLLHLWPWVVQDLASLGARVLFSHFCRSRVYFHVSTRQLQVILLKVALLVGVKVHTETEFRALVEPSSGENGKPFYTVVTKPQIPMVEFTAVLGASGTNDKLAPYAGINRFVFSRREALGIVCYFPNLGTSEETKVKEFSWTQQLKRHMLDKMRKVGLDLENIMYYRGEMHYLVMTPRRQNLLERHVVNVNHENPKELVKDDNVNERELYKFAESVVEFVGVPRRTEFSRVSLFDFSSRTRAEKPANILTCNGKKLYTGLIGDSLLEPLWSEGVGTCRGFLGALDTVWMVAQIGRKSDEQLLADRELAYRVMQRLSGKYRDEMQKNVRKYTADPLSRYNVKFPQIQ